MTTEILGYIATAVVMASFLMSNIEWLRFVNALGCCMWINYGIQIESTPVVMTNCGILAINVFHIIKSKIKKNEEDSNL